jgi:hypothetical protein
MERALDRQKAQSWGEVRAPLAVLLASRYEWLCGAITVRLRALAYALALDRACALGSVGLRGVVDCRAGSRG